MVDRTPAAQALTNDPPAGLFVSWEDLTPGARQRLEDAFAAPEGESAPLTFEMIQETRRVIREHSDANPRYTTPLHYRW